MISTLDVVGVVLKLSSCRSLEAVIQALRDTVRDLISADGITVVLRDVDKCYYVEENAVGPLWKGLRFPMSACISGWCMIHREQVVISDIYADARIPHDAYRPTFVKSLAMTPIRSADPVGAIGAYWASERLATSEELAVLQAIGDSAAMALANSQLIGQLQETSQRKDAFLAMLAHELRNPLAPMRYGAGLLKLTKPDESTIAEVSDMMDRQIGHMSRIVDDLLDVARINNGKVVLQRKSFDLGTLVRQFVEDQRHALDKASLVLKLELPLSKMNLTGDPTRITQVLGNLIDNARKYTPAGGTVAIVVHADQAKHVAHIDIQDTGVGIAPALLPTIFEAFTQADNSLDRTAGGLGLGLSVAKGLIALHEGQLSVHSDGIGHGTLVRIALPGLEKPAALARTEPAEALAAKPLRLLIIEDNKDSARSLQRFLKAYGYGTSVAYDGAAGMDLARSEKPDVILCDIGLPKVDGYTVASTLRQEAEMSGVRMIAVTGYGSEDDRKRAKTAGFDAHVVKPIDLDQLLSEIRVDGLRVADGVASVNSPGAMYQ